MKVTIKEVREAVYKDYRSIITYKYKLYIHGIYEITFNSETAASNYIKYLEEQKKDYEKVIIEKEI
jgi:hypothetical protein